MSKIHTLLLFGKHTDIANSADDVGHLNCCH